MNCRKCDGRRWIIIECGECIGGPNAASCCDGAGLMADQPPACCAVCGRSQADCGHLVASARAAICPDCIAEACAALAAAGIVALASPALLADGCSGFARRALRRAAS